VENLTDIVTVHDASAVTVYESPSAAAVLGYGHNGLIGRKPFRALHPKDRERMTEWLWQIRDGVPGAGAPMEFRYRHAQGRWIWLEAVGKNMLDQRGINGLVLTSRDITRRKVAEDRLRHLSMHDMLTGLPNRGLFSDRLARGIAQAADAGRFLALMFVDLDRFKNVNDALGHEYGDQLLRAAASRLRSEVSEIDTVARLGGDEFAVILRSIERPQYAGFVAEKMLRSLGTPLDIDGRSIRLTASIGTSIYPRDAETQTDLMRLADAAKFAAKRAGGNIHTFYEPGLNASSRQSIMLGARSNAASSSCTTSRKSRSRRAASPAPRPCSAARPKARRASRSARSWRWPRKRAPSLSSVTGSRGLPASRLRTGIASASTCPWP
jgi:diguanylate cyclase (GGDEF)-like protein/PAS domain S-box-containing protein